MPNIFKKVFAGSRKKEINGARVHQEDAKNNINEFEKRITEENYNEWLDNDYEEGQLSIDVYETPKNLVIKSTIAGVKPNDIDISMNNDMLTIRGKREMKETIDSADYLYRECYWGGFSRSIILPCEVKAEKIDAHLEDGVLTVILPKVKTNKDISIKIKEK